MNNIPTMLLRRLGKEGLWLQATEWFLVGAIYVYIICTINGFNRQNDFKRFKPEQNTLPESLGLQEAII